VHDAKDAYNVSLTNLRSTVVLSIGPGFPIPQTYVMELTGACYYGCMPLLLQTDSVKVLNGCR